MKSKKLVNRIFVPVVATLFAGMLAGSTHAAKFGVRVVGSDGRPVAGAAVCIGTHANYKQFGALFTSTKGDVLVDVPVVPLVVTVSKSRFTGLRMVEPARHFNLIKEVKLFDGLPGPRCKADSAMAMSSATPSTKPDNTQLEISDVMVREGVFNLALSPSYVGKPNHYRLSGASSFKNAQWKAFSGPINVENALLDSDSVYLQLRRYKAVPGAAIESRSNIVKINIQGF